jgi:hypothetical protein
MVEALAKMNGVEYFFWSGEGNPKSCVGDWQRTFRRLGAVAGVHTHKAKVSFSPFDTP